MNWQLDPSGLWTFLSVAVVLGVLGLMVGLMVHFTRPDRLRVVTGRLPRMEIEVLGRVPVGEHVWVRDYVTGECVEAVALAHAEDSQATFTRVQLRPRRSGWPRGN